MSLADDLREIDQSTDWAGMQKFGRALAPSIAPTVGAAAMTPLAGPWAGPVVGGMLGEAANNLMGLTEPSVGGYAVQALVPPALRGGANLKRVFPAFGTSARGRESLQEIGKRDLRGIQAEYQPLTPSSDLFSRVGKYPIPMPHTKQESQNVLDRIAKELPVDQPLFKKSGEVAEEYKRIDPAGLPADRFQTSMSTLGQRVRSAGRAEESVGGTVNSANYKRMYGGFAKDLDAVPDPTLKRAREAYKREQTLEDIGDTAKIFTPKGHGEKEQINVNQLMTRLKDDQDELGKFFHQAFNDEERKSILGRLGKINEMPGLGPGTGLAVGSSKVNPLIAAMMGAGSVGAAHGGTAEALGLAAGTYALSGAGRMARDLSIAWNIPAGRAMIQALLDRSGGKVTPEVTAAIQAFAAAQTANLPKTLEAFKEPRRPSAY